MHRSFSLRPVALSLFGKTREASTMAADKKDVKVALTFDFDACCVWIGSLGAKSPSMISRGEFGPIALRRILDLLDRFGVKSTFFITPPWRFPSRQG